MYLNVTSLKSHTGMKNKNTGQCLLKRIYLGRDEMKEGWKKGFNCNFKVSFLKLD